MAKNKNLILGVSATAVIVVLAVLIISISSCSKSSSTTNKNVQGTTPAPVVVQESKGSFDAVIKKKTIKPIRDIKNFKFGASSKQIMKYEATQKSTAEGTLAGPTDDGYSYLTCQFTTEETPSIFGVKPNVSDSMALVSYVFKNDKLIEVRIQYGNVGQESYNIIVNAIKAQYGESTFSRSYSNGNLDSWWNTKKVSLRAISQDDGVHLYYSKK